MQAATTTEQDAGRVPGEPLYDEETGVFIGVIRQGVLCVPRQKNGRQVMGRVSVAWLAGRLAGDVQT